ncbi:amino acid adenylation domain-containing protein [Zobellia laminariae]|uniref:amino acid adenylation domain-containing protein n=2 Tax=Zobellia laminariae TaxID=248906 RepID=UPI0026F47B3A|nr:amino acid adenylation domain-containing protein [Zobellia laminariae]WKX76445.1 amino acid adenylation domain-containing protein [Zobellia laminariae]
MKSIYTLPQLIENVARASPNREAFRYLEETISYSELHKKTDQLASYLISIGIKKGDRVGIFMNRCLETSIAVYGILKAGAVYVPLDTAAPLHKTAAIINDCQISCLITTTTKRRKVDTLLNEKSTLNRVIGDTLKNSIPSVAWDDVFSIELDDYTPPTILEQDLAFILYTSGSTGMPKGIMHTHYSGLSLAKIAADTYNFNPDDIFGNPAPLHFDPSTFGYFVSPLVGATTVIIPDAHLKMPASLSALISKERITVWYSVPLMLLQLLHSETLDKHDFSSLRWVLFAGEVFITKHLRALMKKWPNARFSNLYGPAELILCTYYNVLKLPKKDEPIPIGNVWANTEYKILDENNNDALENETGQLAVRSATMMQGYWNNKSLTEQSFHKVTIADGYEHIYYKTGDLVKLNNNGELLFLGRNDRQIKLRGYRVELDEIELTLLKHNDIEEVAVLVLGKDEEVQELAAVIKPLKGVSINLTYLREFCKIQLPSYAIPKTIEFMKDLPRTSSGKISRKEIGKLLEEHQL